jgi:ubiquitin-protein ligase
MGEIRLNTLQEKWAPNMNMHECIAPAFELRDRRKRKANGNIALLSIYKLLMEPNPDYPADSEVSQLWKSDREAYNRKATDTVQ